jgi:hypothetical protein
MNKVRPKKEQANDQAVALNLSGCVVQLAGPVIEKSHGLHCHTYRFSETARLISCRKIIDRPQTGQIVSAVGTLGSNIAH